ncbi:glycoside hydrolase family 27 protein [uncultured Gordonia sp.]|uniref:glycoside hydrolase family 27 protein n=1 Tax=uncultured Gordonia sp. TaxID=198437 RepID=UPI002605D986|nr:glycoside hydrolase family 27 protein [uncultured Gordonia sp.]
MSSRLRVRAAVAALLVAVFAVGCTADPEDRIGGQRPAIDGVAKPPPMGWDSGPSLGCKVTEQSIHQQADALVSSGLREAGYRYVIVGDCWSAPERAADGALRPDPVRFPSGMAALGEYLHDRGLWFGLSSTAGTRTCAQHSGRSPGSTGSLGREARDAATFADWGVDYLSYDWCSGQSDREEQIAAFTAMRDALREVGKPIVYAINPNRGLDATRPGSDAYWGGVATVTRVTGPTVPAWSSAGRDRKVQGVIEVIDALAPLAGRVRPGTYNDPGLLQVGIADGAGDLTESEQRTQFSMWAMMAAPLIIGVDLTTMPPSAVRTLTNGQIVRIDQDKRVSAGARVANNPEIWSRAVGDKGLVVSLTNRGKAPRKLSVALSDLGLVGDATVGGVDAWTGERYRAVDGKLTVTVAAHDTAVLTIV